MSKFTCSHCGNPSNDSDRAPTTTAKACIECWRAVRAEVVRNIKPHKVQLSYPTSFEGGRQVSFCVMDDCYNEVVAFNFSPEQWTDLLSTLRVSATPTTTADAEREIRRRLKLALEK